jgi:exodeoxyribonuclease VII large subunit
MLFGTSSSIDKDVRQALGQHAPAYHIEDRQIPLTNPAAVAAALSSQKIDADLVAIVRGGGEGVSALSDRQVIEAVARQVPLPIVSAVGHEVDQPLIQDLVHHAFSTPFDFGRWLADRATGAIRERDTMAADHRRELEGLRLNLQKSESTLQHTREQLLALQRRNVVLIAGVAVLVVILVASWAF